eukprot:2993867-Pleurochrysis_carterae.AAC.1
MPRRFGGGGGGGVLVLPCARQKTHQGGGGRRQACCSNAQHCETVRWRSAHARAHEAPGCVVVAG